VAREAEAREAASPVRAELTTELEGAPAVEPDWKLTDVPVDKPFCPGGIAVLLPPSPTGNE